MTTFKNPINRINWEKRIVEESYENLKWWISHLDWIENYNLQSHSEKVKDVWAQEVQDIKKHIKKLKNKLL